MVDNFLSDNPLSADLVRLPNKAKTVAYGSSEANLIEPNDPGHFFQFISNLCKEDDACVPMAVNIVFEHELFMSIGHFVLTLDQKVYKKSLKKRPTKESAEKPLRFAASSVTNVVDQHGIQWKKEEIIDHFALRRKKQLINSPKAYYNEILNALEKNSKREQIFKQKAW